ncbi:MAG TPA: O-antigen ligase family protein [Brevefilum sp.]|nr:O-antigen ligase family protein [Brevefilum sp.]HOR19702.1 O-antigen ligase family protein [Brevefilum sp.]HPL69529.1 O-antigen ligase family protein [Brevefilum sp.]
MLSRITSNRFYQGLCTLLLALVLIGLPLTSVPFLTRITGSLVAPFSALPLFGLVLIWLIPYLLRHGSFPKDMMAIFYFIIVAVISSASAYFLDGFYVRDRTFFDQSLRALLTLAIGLSFYATLSAYLRQRSALQQAVLFIYIGGMGLILWSVMEIIVLHRSGSVQNFPAWLTHIKSVLVFQQPGMLFTNRLTALAYEPSWYVLIFTLVLLPLWLSAVFQRKSLFSIKLWRFIVEDVLLLAGMTVFMFSFPRIGLLALIVMLLYFGIQLTRRLFDKINTWLINHKRFKVSDTTLFRTGLTLALITLTLIILISAAAIFIKIASQQDARFQLIIDLFSTNTLKKLPTSETDIILFSRGLAFMERTIYWFGGWRIFADYPFGVGLGNAGFYMIDRINSLGYGSFEVRNILYQSVSLMNTKSLWIRLLAETGFIGLSVYLTWLYLLWRNSTFIQKSDDALLQIVGMAGKFFILAYLVEGFSVDTFAFPYPWVTASLISAGSLIMRKEIQSRRPLHADSAKR